MKFKVIFLLFNVIILFSFLLLFFLPLVVLGGEFAASLWKDAWYFSLLFLAILVGLNLYFSINWRFFTFLEQEKWEELISLLEEQIYHKSRGRRGLYLTRQRIQILINGCMVTSRMEKLKTLDSFLRERQPKMHGAFVLPLGLPYLLEEDSHRLEEYYAPFIDDPKVAQREWCRWFYAFALLLQKKIDEARTAIEGLFGSKEPIIRLLAVYLFHIAGGDVEKREELVAVREELKISLAPHKFGEMKEKQGDNILLLVLSDFLEKAHKWLLSDGKEEA